MCHMETNAVAYLVNAGQLDVDNFSRNGNQITRVVEFFCAKYETTSSNSWVD